ncbi:MAG: molecular chaperone Hsp90, partial [Bilophila sp.]
HNAVAAQAEAKNLALSWFAAPHLPRRYEGPRAQLAEVLALLAESSVRATERGMVQIRAQRLPESTDPGHLLFTVSDSGKGTPPLTRSSLALVRAWELVGQTEDFVTLESGPNGATVSFSIRLTARMAEQRAPLKDADADVAIPEAQALLSRLPASSLRIIVASSVPGNRQLLAYYLDELPHEILESRSAEEVRSIYFRSPGALIIFDDDIAEEEISRVITDIRAFEGEHHFPLASILALVSDEGQGERLHLAGCTHFL